MMPPAGPPTILIIDDMPSNLGVLVQLFENRGYRVSIAQDGEEGIQRAQLLQPELILLDVMMPGSDGFETCRRLKAQENTRDIPVIFMTALAMPEHKVKGFQAGAVDYVTKPLQIDETLSRVDTHLKLHAAHRRLEEQNARLDRHREELELRVAERTAELAVREREFRTLAENAPDVIARHDRRCRYLYVNRQHEETIGMPAGDVIGKTPVELLPGNPGVAAYQARMAAVIETGQTADFEATLPDEGEGPRYHSIRLAAERDANGEVVGVLAIGRDVTARMRAERELRLLNRALDNAFDATYLVDFDLRFRYVNEAAAHVLGYSREELLSMNLLDVDPSVTREAVRGMMRQTADSGRFPGTIESRHRRKDGTTFPIEVGAATFVNEGETLFLTTVRDITERKRMEASLGEREQRYRQIFDNASDGLYLLEVTPDGRFRNLDVNPALEQSTGMSRADLVGRFVDETVSPEAAQRVMAKYRRCVEAGTALDEEVELDLPIGKRYYHSTLIPVPDENGRIHRIVGVSRDVTAYRLFEDELLRRIEVEARLSKLVAAAPGVLGTFVLTGSGHAYMPDAGPRLEEVIGFRPEEVGEAGEGASALHNAIHPDDLPRHLERIAKSARDLTPCHSEFRLNHPVKGEIWIEGRSMPERLPDGGTIWHGFFHDITERKRAEAELAEYRGQLEDIVAERTAALQESEARLRALIDNLPLEFWAKDSSLRYVMQNAESLRSRGPVVGKRVEELGVPLELASKWMELDRRALAGEILHAEYEKDASGEIRTYESLVAPVTSGGAVVGIVGVGMDITERRRAEDKIRVLNAELEGRVRARTAQLEEMNRELRESEQRFRTLAENAPDLIMRYDRECRRLYVNPAYEREIAIPRAQAVSALPDAQWRAVNMPVEEYKACLRQVMETGEPTEIIVGWPRQDAGGAINYYATRIVAEHGRESMVTGALAMAHNITALKQAERSLEKSHAELRELAARRDQAREEERKRIARELHDDLGQYLTALRLKVSVLDIEFGTAMPELGDKLRGVMELVDSTKQVVRNVAAALRPAALDMGLSSAIEWLAEDFSKRTGMSCSAKLEEDTAGLDDIGITAAFRIVQESLTNVARHAEASSVTISLEREGDAFFLEICDDGQGFDVSASRKNSFGLIGMRERLLILGGSLEVASVPGHGTMVRTRIPAREEQRRNR